MPLITYGLCILCILISVAKFTSDPTSGSAWARIGNFSLLSPYQVWDGGYYALLTSFFPHGDLAHLAFNMIWLVQLGRVIETTLPPLGYFAFLVAACAVSMACELALSGNTGIGASGVVYAMFGLMWMGRARYPSWQVIATRQNLNIFLIWGVFCVYASWAGFMSVANVAHGSGFLFGLSIGGLFLALRRQPLWAIPVGLLVALTVLSVTWLPWSGEWSFYKGNQAFKRQQYASAVTWYHRSLRMGGERYYNWENIRRAWHNMARDAALRNDLAGMEEALHQEQSAANLEGSEPSSPASASGSGTGFPFSRQH